MKKAKNIIETQRIRIVTLTDEVAKVREENEKYINLLKEANKAVKEAYKTLKKDTDTRKAVEAMGNMEVKGIIKLNKLFIIRKWKSIMGNS